MAFSDDPNNLNFPLMFLDQQKKNVWTLEDAVCGTAIFGTTGSGKSSSSGRNVAKAFLQAGYGGLVLTAKDDEKGNWVRYAKECDRLDDLIIFSESNRHLFRFNFLEYELKRATKGGGLTSNIVSLFMTLYGLADGGKKSAQRSEDQFWQAALKRLITRLVALIKISGEPLTIDTMYNLVTSALHDSSQWHDDTFIANSYCVKCLELAHENDGQSPEYTLVDRYWSNEFPNLDEKTRSIIKESFLGLCEPFLSGMMRELFMSDSTISPEITQEGTILVLDLPVHQYMDQGLFAQVIFKYIWQRCIQQRDIEQKPIPNFLWVDEAQYFVSNEHDMMFQTTARSSKTCSVYLSQNISNYYSVMSGSHPKEQTDSLLANLATRIFHANLDTVTNEWAANSIGKAFQPISSYQTKMSEDGSSAGMGYQLHHIVQPLEFTTLLTGGASNNYTVEAIVSVAGRRWANGKNYLKLSFDQRA